MTDLLKHKALHIIDPDAQVNLIIEEYPAL